MELKWPSTVPRSSSHRRIPELPCAAKESATTTARRTLCVLGLALIQLHVAGKHRRVVPLRHGRDEYIVVAVRPHPGAQCFTREHNATKTRRIPAHPACVAGEQRP